MVKKGNFEGSNILPEAYIKKASTLQNRNDNDYEQDYYLSGDGFRWRLKSSYGHFKVEHGGNNFGFSSEMLYFPFEGIGIVVLTNENLSLLPYIVADIIVKRLFELEPENEYPTVVAEIYKPNPKSKGLNKEKLPLQPLENFVGTYSAKGFGIVEVIKEGHELFTIIPTYKFQLEHLNYNRFFLKGTSDFVEPFSPVFTSKFIHDTSGKINLLEIYSQKEPIKFEKKLKESEK